MVASKQLIKGMEFVPLEGYARIKEICEKLLFIAKKCSNKVSNVNILFLSKNNEGVYSFKRSSRANISNTIFESSIKARFTTCEENQGN